MWSEILLMSRRETHKRAGTNERTDGQKRDWFFSSFRFPPLRLKWKWKPVGKRGREGGGNFSLTLNVFVCDAQEGNSQGLFGDKSSSKAPRVYRTLKGNPGNRNSNRTKPKRNPVHLRRGWEKKSLHTVLEHHRKFVFVLLSASFTATFSLVFFFFPPPRKFRGWNLNNVEGKDNLLKRLENKGTCEGTKGGRGALSSFLLPLNSSKNLMFGGEIYFHWLSERENTRERRKEK